MTERKRSGFLFLIISAMLVIAASGKAADPLDYSGSPQNEYDPFEAFFEKEEALEITLKFNIKEYIKTKDEEKYQPAILFIGDSDTASLNYPVRLKSRGIFRKSYCQHMPPFWLNISKSGIQSDSFEGMKKMKIVTHCMNRPGFENYLLKEYLVYKLYNIVSPYSFRVRLLRITYIDTGKKNKRTQAWAFAIEHKIQLAERLDATLVENDSLVKTSMQASEMDRLAMFHYMIGNTDYSIKGRHNIEIIVAGGQVKSGYIPIPYDFDYTGFVNSSYAIPAEYTDLKEVTTRYFTGPCRPDYVYKQLIEEFRTYKTDVFSVIENFQYLGTMQKSELIGFIDAFFVEIEGKNFIGSGLRPFCQ